MGTFNAFYVRSQEDNGALLPAIRERFPHSGIEVSAQFVGVAMAESAYVAPESDLAALSSLLGTDVIWLSFQSYVDAFQFHHWRAGVQVRTLVYGCFHDERTWERVEGESEPWEREVLFDRGVLEHDLKYASSERERRELQRIWREAEILPGRVNPRLDSRECAHKIAAHYQFPHYCL